MDLGMDNIRRKPVKNLIRCCLDSLERYKKLIYIFEPDLVWRMQSIILKVTNSCCMCRELLTFNAY